KMAQLARSGYDDDLTDKDRREVLPVMPFTEGLDVRSGGLAKLKRGRYAPLVVWMLGLLAFMFATGEALLRTYAPALSYKFSMLKALPEYKDLPDAAVLEKISFK